MINATGALLCIHVTKGDYFWDLLFAFLGNETLTKKLVSS